MIRAAINCLWFSAIFLAPPLKADTVKLTDRPAFENVRILDFRNGRLAFRGVSGEVLRKPLAEIDWIAADEAPGITAAERVRAAGDFAFAVEQYETKADPAAWVQAVALRRRIDCAARLARPDLAVDALLKLLEVDAEFEPGLTRLALAEPRSEPNTAALRRLRGANLRGNSAMIGLRLELTILEEPESVSGEFRAPAGDGDAEDEGDDRLFARSRMKFGGHNLPENGLLREAIRDLADAGRAANARVRYDAARPFIPAESAAAWRLLEARLLIDEGRPAEAADRLVSLRTAGGDAEFEAETGYDLGLAHERLGQSVLAAELYRELAAREDTPAAWKTRAETALQRVAPESKELSTRPATGPATQPAARP